MFNRKWEKAPPLSFNYPKRFNFVQRDIFVGRNHYLVWGIPLLFNVCILNFIPPHMTLWPFRQILPVAEASQSAFDTSPGSQPTTISSSVDPVNPESSKEKSKDPSGPGPSQQNGHPPSQQKPSILVPQIPDKENGQVVGIYKSKIEETQNLMRTINESQLTGEQHDTLISINSFLEKAQEAYSQNDMSMAVNLAEKAHTLSKEIVKSSKQQ